MLLVKDLNFILEQHPFYGITIKIQHNNKMIGTYSPQLPQDVRAMLRQVLSHKDISGKLEDFLLNATELPRFTIKVKYNKYECEWDPKLFYEKKLCFNIDNTQVLINQDDTTDDILFLSDTFCYFKNKQKLGRITSQKGFQSIDQLSIHNFQDAAIQKLFQKKKYEISNFNQLPFHLNSSNEFKSCRFISQKNEVVPEEIAGDLFANIDYSVEKNIVKFSLLYNDNDQIHPAFSSIYKRFKKQAVLFEKYTFKRKKILLSWLIRYIRADKNRQEVLINKYLPKLNLLNEIQVIIGMVKTISNEFSYQLKVVNDSWYIYKIDSRKEIVLAFMTSLLFPESSENSDEYFDLIIYKMEFNRYLKVIKYICKQLDVAVLFSNKEVNIVEKKLRVDLSDTDSLTGPKIYLDNVLIDEDSLVNLKTNLWTAINQQQVDVFDESLIAQCEQLILLKEFQNKRLKQADTTQHKQSLHLLDWIQLRHLGVDIKLSAQQEALMNSFMSFRNLKDVEVPKQLSAQPRSYQKEGLNWMMFLYNYKLGGVLADDMGLGKTFQSLMLIASIKESNKNNKEKLKPHLIVVPPSLIFNWYNEFKRFCPDIDVSIYVGQDRKLDSKSEVIVTSYELIRRENELFSSIEFDIVIFDEAQFIKNNLSARAKAAHNIQRNCCLCLTGTPIENHVGEYINILNTALPGFMPGTTSSVHSISEKEINIIIRRSKPFVLRRLKSQIIHELKAKTEEVIYLNMNPSQKEFYNSMLTAAKREYEKSKKEPKSQMFILTTLMRLRQVSVSPFLVDKNYSEITPKFNFLIEKLKILQSEGHSVLVFSQFLPSLDLLEGLCKQEQLPLYRLDGSVSVFKRKKYIEEFQSSEEPQIFLISLKAGGVGLNLTKASYVFHLDPWWNPAVENQATDRVHRIGQKNHVFSYKLIMHDTVEEKIQELKSKKTDLFNMLLDNSQIVNRSQALSEQDIKYLLDV